MKVYFYLVLVLALVSIGCWDMVDIDQRSIVIGIAFDAAEEPNKYTMTMEMPTIGATISGGGGENGGNQGDVIMASTLGRSVAEMQTNLEKRYLRPIFFGHMKTIIISEEVARNSIHPFIDFFERNPQTDRRLKFVIAEGDARDILKAETPKEPLTGRYISQLLETQLLINRVVLLNFQDVILRLNYNGNAVVPRIRATDNEVVVGGAAVVKDYKLVGWLGEVESEAIQFIYNQVRGGRLSVNLEAGFITFSIHSSRTRLVPVLEDGQLFMDISIELEGNIVEFVDTIGYTVSPHIPAVQVALENKIRDQIHHTVIKMQHEFQADAIGYYQATMRRYPKLWSEHKDNWDEEFFPTIKTRVNVSASVRRTGVLD